MKLHNLQTIPSQALTLEALCKEVESEYYAQVNQACNSILKYLRKNPEMPGVPKSISELVHIIFYQLNFEIRQCVIKEKKELFPLIIKATALQRVELAETIESFKEAHASILKITQKLRQILNNYVIPSHSNGDLKSFINDCIHLENNIYKWIYVEEDLLFPKVYSDVAKEKFIATVFR